MTIGSQDGGMLGGMRQKTSLSLDPGTAATARQHAALAGLDLSAWVERAIRHLAVVEDLPVYDRWRESWTDDDKATEAAFEALDRAGLPE
jgi:hypothetical protein